MITICRLRPSTNPLQALMSENLDANCSLPGVSVYLLDSLWSRRDPKDPGINQGLGGEQKSKGSCFGPNDPKSYRRKKKRDSKVVKATSLFSTLFPNLKLHYKTCQKNVKNKLKTNCGTILVTALFSSPRKELMVLLPPLMLHWWI